MASNSNTRVTRNNTSYQHVPSNQQPYYQENEKVLSGFTAYVSKISQRSQRSRRRFLDLGLPLLHSCDNMKPGLAMTVA
ncbi:hypothetical protein M8J76_016809 [Diaphorina citri]|nr:hypothetical protein M8J75_014027 [Diaphorina citri]KAI5741757.1 hypothetical protein M8J76_016809 [Diaphorina citri]KAI5746826.1 hypothetical protein M8J77_007827 [Diaphorina citri]